MKITSECYACIYSQVLRVGDVLKLSERQKAHLMQKAAPLLADMSYSLSPPQNALAIYDMIARELDIEDIYKDVKNDARQKARSFIPLAKEYISKAQDGFEAALKVAVIANMIDLASQKQYDFESEFESLLAQPFAIDESAKLKERLLQASCIVYLADNAGEDIFDAIFLEYLHAYSPHLQIYYFARSKPIINDITYAELKTSEINAYAKVVDSGAKTPGFVYEDASVEALEIIQQCDCVISKGMGNYECLSDVKKNDIFYLLKVKCSVVSASIGAPLGSLICTYSPKDDR